MLLLTMQAAVVKVMGRILPNDRYKSVFAIKFCKIKFTEFHSDERRKVKLYMSRLRRELMIAGMQRGETLLVKRMASQCRSTTFRA